MFNKNLFLRKYIFSYAFVFILILSITIQEVSANSAHIKKNQFLPVLSFIDILPSEHTQYLGIDKKNKFSFKDFHGSIFIIELFSTYCMSCPKNYPILNSIYNYIESNKKLKDNVKVFGIAVGNTKDEVDEHIKKYKLIFPILTDYQFIFHKATGSPRVPFTIICKKITKNKFKILYIHEGIIESEDIILKNIPHRF
ncbi:MAG: TlpA family protein disulfide reductase [Nitrospirae bacterium]|jgi:peroxiredoxin|nr:TlpA family protein disulfide reductase [Nitrospirota bacterium]